jgi:hypothetical protein
MAAMTIRTTVAFDPATAARLERLAKRWGVSKSEAMRRALEQAEEAERTAATTAPEIPDFTGMSPIEILDWLGENPQVPGGWGNDARRELLEMRERDAEIEEERERERARLRPSLVAESEP